MNVQQHDIMNTNLFQLPDFLCNLPFIICSNNKIRPDLWWISGPEAFGLTQAGAGAGALDDGVFAGVVEDRAFGQGDVRCHPRDGYPETKCAGRYPEGENRKRSRSRSVGNIGLGKTASSPALEFVFQEVKERLLHHVRHLEMRHPA